MREEVKNSEFQILQIFPVRSMSICEYLCLIVLATLKNEDEFYHDIFQISIMDTPLSPDMDREKEMMMELQVNKSFFFNNK